jgi:diketogulonate reductase-like aldo/keto reductase
MNLFDTAEMYGNGRCETALGKTLEGIPRDRLFMVDKIHPDHTTPASFARSLDHSLIRLDTDYIDLYLLHWRENVDLPFLVDAMHEAQRQGKIRHWGVSNFTIEDMKDLFAAGGTDCFCDQIFYTLYERGAEYDLVPFLKEHDILPMSYSSLGSNYYPHPDIRRSTAVMEACRTYGIAPEAVMLRMNTEQGFAALFSTSSLSHLHSNLQEVPDEAYREIFARMDQEFPAPDHGYPLVKI